MVEYETRCIQSNFTGCSPIKTKSNKQRHFFAGEEYLVWLCKICFCLKVLEVYSRVKSFVTFCVEGDNLKHKTHTKPNNQFSFKLKQISSKIKKCHKNIFCDSITTIWQPCNANTNIYLKMFLTLKHWNNSHEKLILHI